MVVRKMDAINDNSKSLLKMVYNCKSNEFESMLERIEMNLEKTKMIRMPLMLN
jgi:hypothetical protein